MKRLTLLLATTAAALSLSSCENFRGTITGSIDIPGGDGKSPVGTIAFSHTWPQAITTPVITGVTIKGETLPITPAAIKADPIEPPAESPTP